MRNYEKYAEEIKKFGVKESFCDNFIKPHILKSSDCSGMNCVACRMFQAIWLLEEYEEPEVDWSRVKVDAPILVRDTEYDEWEKRYFAKYEDGEVFAWGGGCTSWTASGGMIPWRYAKLAESEEE